DQVRDTLIQERLLATLSGLVGALALLLAGLGLYGITAYTVSRRRNEIAIRMALGAAPAGVVGLILTRVIVLVVLGLVIGSAARAGLTICCATSATRSGRSASSRASPRWRWSSWRSVSAPRRSCSPSSIVCCSDRWPTRSRTGW